MQTDTINAVVRKSGGDHSSKIASYSGGIEMRYSSLKRVENLNAESKPVFRMHGPAGKSPLKIPSRGRPVNSTTCSFT
jgi:hypothetical protein